MNNVNMARQVLDTIKKYDKIIIFRHFRPDGDAIGSSLAMAAVLRQQGHTAVEQADIATVLAAGFFLLLLGFVILNVVCAEGTLFHKAQSIAQLYQIAVFQLLQHFHSD